MVALQQIYKMLALQMELKLPNILQGFFNSKMLENVDQNGDIFMNDSKQTRMLRQGKHNQSIVSIVRKK